MQATSDSLQQEFLKALSRVLPSFDQDDCVNMQDQGNLSADLILLQTVEIRFYRATKSKHYQTGQWLNSAASQSGITSESVNLKLFFLQPTD